MRKDEIIPHYSGGTNQCFCCGAEERLCLDHIRGKGEMDRMIFSDSGHSDGSAFDSFLELNNFPIRYETELQVLCCACNIAKGCWQNGTCAKHRKVSKYPPHDDTDDWLYHNYRNLIGYVITQEMIPNCTIRNFEKIIYWAHQNNMVNMHDYTDFKELLLAVVNGFDEEDQYMLVEDSHFGDLRDVGGWLYYLYGEPGHMAPEYRHLMELSYPYTMYAKTHKFELSVSTLKCARESSHAIKKTKEQQYLESECEKAIKPIPSTLW